MAKMSLSEAAAARKAKKAGVNVNKNYSPKSFKFGAESSAYKKAARATLKSGGTVLAAARAGRAADRRAAPRGGKASQANS